MHYEMNGASDEFIRQQRAIHTWCKTRKDQRQGKVDERTWTEEASEEAPGDGHSQGEKRGWHQNTRKE